MVNQGKISAIVYLPFHYRLFHFRLFFQFEKQELEKKKEPTGSLLQLFFLLLLKKVLLEFFEF